MTLEDLTLQCTECNNDFQFTAGEQEFYQSKGLVNTPKRCPQCRSNRKNKNRRPQRQLYDVTCSECGEPAKVPFRPTEDKPVYCRGCFESSKLSV